MAKNSKKNKKNKKLLIIVIVLLILLVIGLIVIFQKLNLNGNNPVSEEELLKRQEKYLEEKAKEDVQKLSNMSEQERMEYYCGKFFGLINSKLYDEAYKLLYSEYKENYFPTLANFKKYFEEYFPEEIGLSYQNTERLGDIYVLTVSVTDGVNFSYGKNFSLFVVIQEKELNDFVISFSRNSAVDDVESEG